MQAACFGGTGRVGPERLGGGAAEADRKWYRRLRGPRATSDPAVATLVREVEALSEQVRVLARLARTEPLTGLANRRGWDEQLARELARARRSGEPLSVALLDVDDFKAFNDAHGHQAGDRLLLEAAAAWDGQLRDVRHPLPLGRRRVRGSPARLPPTPG
jgi:GAF domain-containing protein